MTKEYIMLTERQLEIADGGELMTPWGFQYDVNSICYKAILSIKETVGRAVYSELTGMALSYHRNGGILVAYQGVRCPLSWRIDSTLYSGGVL